MTYKAVIFDLDGTISIPFKIMNSVLKSNHYYPTYSYSAYKHFVGSGIMSSVIKQRHIIKVSGKRKQAMR